MRNPITPKLNSVVRGRKPVGLALQGGGSWGAYTWGVLDAVLASRSLGIDQLSGTSAGAINAAIVASALARGGRGAARKALRAFWMDVAYPGVAAPGHELWAPVERAWRDSINAWMLASSTSPYQLNPLGINPLRDLITRHIDIDALKSPSAPALYVTVTNVKTGMPRVIANGDMSVDVLLASACLPELFQAVEIDGVPYWDGGYSGNPTLWPMIQGGGTRDLIVVQLAPDEVAGAPTDASGIRRRIGEIVFNSSLVAEMQAISAMRALAGGTDVRSSVIDTRLHRIGPPPPALFAHGTSFERSREWLLRLYDEGRRAARRFIARHGANVGVRETLDVSRVFADDRSSMMYRSANDETFAVTRAPISRALM